MLPLPASVRVTHGRIATLLFGSSAKSTKASRCGVRVATPEQEALEENSDRLGAVAVG